MRLLLCSGRCVVEGFIVKGKGLIRGEGYDSNDQYHCIVGFVQFEHIL